MTYSELGMSAIRVLLILISMLILFIVLFVQLLIIRYPFIINMSNKQIT